MQEQLKTAVGRFVTLRAPDKAATADTDLLFVRMQEFPVDVYSFYVNALATAGDDIGYPSPGEKRARLHEVAESYINSSYWKENNFAWPLIFDFEQYLGNNKETITRDELLAKASDLLGTSEELNDSLIYWDNFLVCVVEDYDIHYRQKVATLLKVDYILMVLNKVLTTATNDQIQKLLSAQIVLPKFPYHKFVSEPAPKATPTPFKKTTERLVERGSHIQSYEEALNGIKELEKFAKKIQEELVGMDPESQEYADLAANQGMINEETTDFFENPTEAIEFLSSRLGLPTPIKISIEEAKKQLSERASKSFSEAFSTVRASVEVVQSGGGFWAKKADYIPEEEEQQQGDYIPNGSLYKDFYQNGRECNPMPFLVADLMVINQEFCCLLPGEVSHIENVMATEKKSNKTRRTVTIDETVTRGSEKNTSEERDRQSTERNELQSVVSSMLAESSSMNFTANLNAKWGSVTLDTGFGYSENNSSASSQEQARNFAKELTERAVSKVSERVYEERSTRTIRTFEEDNEHTFFNDTVNHIVGMYRWMNKKLKNTVTNYGKRLMLELFVPEPAAFHFFALASKMREGQLQAVAQQNTLEAPINPKDGFDFIDSNNVTRHITLLRPQDVTEANYLQWAQLYGAEVKAPPAERMYLTNSVTSTDKDGNPAAYDCSVDIPKGYMPKSLSFSFAQDAEGNTDMWFIIGSNPKLPVGTSTTVSGGTNTNPLMPEYHYPDMGGVYTGTITSTVMGITITRPIYQLPNIDFGPKLPITVFGRSRYFGLNTTVLCQRTDDSFLDWQRSVYQAVMAAYKKQKDAYDVAFAAATQAVQAASSMGFGGSGFAYQAQNPMINREIERTELKRAAIYYMNGGKMPSPENNWVDALPMDIDYEHMPEFSYCANIGNTPYVKFMESAFDWQNMAYQFFPYFYGRKSNWVNLYLTQDADPLFANFLKAGYAKVLIPVQPGREKDVLAFMSSGNVFGKTTREVSEHPLVLDILAQFNDPKPTQSVQPEAWFTVVPTNLICLQNDASPMDDNALQCDC